MEPSSFADLWDYAQKQGVLAVVLLLILYGTYRVGRWFEPRLDKIISELISLIETLRTESPRQTNLLRRLLKTSQRNLKVAEELRVAAALPLKCHRALEHGAKVLEVLATPTAPYHEEFKLLAESLRATLGVDRENSKK